MYECVCVVPNNTPPHTHTHPKTHTQHIDYYSVQHLHCPSANRRLWRNGVYEM